MRTMLKFSIPVEAGNKAAVEKRIGPVLGNVIERVRPEAAYFFAENGKRAGLIVLDLKESTDIPRIAETFFLELNADVTFIPVMNADDLKAGLAKVNK